MGSLLRQNIRITVDPLPRGEGVVNSEGVSGVYSESKGTSRELRTL